MTEKRVMKLASRGKRFGAACIDAFVPFVSYLLYTAVMAANGYRNYSPGYGYGFGNDFGYGYGYGFGYGNGFGSHHLSGASAAIMVVVFFILMAYIIAQLVLFAKGKSIGKAILGLQVISSTDGKPFRFWKMFFRECFVKSASGSAFGLGYIWILVDDKNRGWHDKILDSYVVDLKESERMTYMRHMAQAKQTPPVPDTLAVPETSPEPEPEIKEEISIMPEAIPSDEPAIEVTPEIADGEDAEAPGDPEEPEASITEEEKDL